jgi:hypothetical protein
MVVPCKNDKGRQACGCRFSSDRACRSVVYFYGCFFKLRIKLQTKLCRFRQGSVVSDNALLFPTRLCRFRQGFVVSDKALSFPTRLCRFRQALCRFRQALCRFRQSFVGKSRATILHNTPDVILRTLVPRRTYMTSVFAVTRRQGLPVLQYLHKAAGQTYQIRFVQNR